MVLNQHIFKKMMQEEKIQVSVVVTLCPPALTLVSGNCILLCFFLITCGAIIFHCNLICFIHLSVT